MKTGNAEGRQGDEVPLFTQPDGIDPLPVNAEQAITPTQKYAPIVSLARRPVLAIAAGVGLVLLLTSGRVGYFCDELYYLAAGYHLDWGYPDQGPLVPLLARAMNIVFPGSLVGERLPATVLTAVGVVVAALIARELGGRRRAQVLTAGTYAMAAMAGGHLLMTATVDVFFWVMATWLLVRWVRLRDDQLLLWLGVVTAIALQNKWLIATFWLVVALSVLAVGPRDLLRRPLLWLQGREPHRRSLGVSAADADDRWSGSGNGALLLRPVAVTALTRAARLPLPWVQRRWANRFLPHHQWSLLLHGGTRGAPVGRGRGGVATARASTLVAMGCHPTGLHPIRDHRPYGPASIAGLMANSRKTGVACEPWLAGTDRYGSWRLPRAAARHAAHHRGSREFVLGR
jgi:hypothetical protein